MYPNTEDFPLRQSKAEWDTLLAKSVANTVTVPHVAMEIQSIPYMTI